MKRTFALLLSLSLVLMAFTGCAKEEKNAENNVPAAQTTEAVTEAAPIVKSDGFAKFDQLTIGMTEEEVNAIMGEPSKVDKAYYYYDITVNGQPMTVTVWINMGTGLVTYVQGDFYKGEYRAEFMDQATDLSAVDGLETEELNSYEDCAAAFQSPGIRIMEDEDGALTYLWVDQYDGYMSVTFRADGTVKTYSGVC